MFAEAVEVRVEMREDIVDVCDDDACESMMTVWWRERGKGKEGQERNAGSNVVVICERYKNWINLKKSKCTGNPDHQSAEAALNMVTERCG